MKTTYMFAKQDPSDELGRLRLVEAAFDPGTRWLLHEAGVAPGWRCLEVGAGAGSMLRWLGERVGPSGRVVGLDRQTVHLGAFTSAPYEIVQNDLLDYRSPQPFDLIHIRYVLIHNLEPDRLLAHLKSLLRPGGLLAVEEPDFEAGKWLDPAYRDACQRVNDAIVARYRNLGLDPGFGSHLPWLLRQQGFTLRLVKSENHLEPGGHPVGAMMARSAAAMREQSIKTGATTSEDIDTYIHAAADPESLSNYYATVQVLARA